MTLVGEYWTDFEEIDPKDEAKLRRISELDKIINKSFINLDRYPKTGNHQECGIFFKDELHLLPFQIRKGKDGYTYADSEGNRKEYNLSKDGRMDKRWIVHLDAGRLLNPSLQDIFEIKVNKSLVSIIEYCVDIYKKSIIMEIERMSKELSLLGKF